MDEAQARKRLQAEIKDLQEWSAKYREAGEQVLDQLDECVDHLNRQDATRGIARQLRKNQRSIRRQLR